MKKTAHIGQLSVIVILAGAACLLMAGGATASTWVDEIGNSMSFYKTNYPGSNFEPYLEKVSKVREALGRSDRQTVRTEMSKLFSMLRTRAHGLNDVAADELFNFCLMVTPIEEYKISVPQAAPTIPGLP